MKEEVYAPVACSFKLTLSIHIYLTAKNAEKRIHTPEQPQNDSTVHRLPLISVNGRFSPLFSGLFFGLLSKLIFKQIPQAVSDVGA